MILKSSVLNIVILVNLISLTSASTLYTETFADSDLSSAGWSGVYTSGNAGIYGEDFVWVWHNGDCENLIYTTEFTVDTSTYTDIAFLYDLRRHTSYTSTPQTSVMVRVGGSWYVSKTVFTSSNTDFAVQSLDYDPSKDNWDTLSISTAARGSTASSDLSGNITGFGLYSNSQNLGESCTAEYDNFTITATEVQTEEPSPDIDGSGTVDVVDFNQIAKSWQTVSGDTVFNELCDLDTDNDIDISDLSVFAQAWLTGVKYPFVPQTSDREKINFNTNWLFYKGSISGNTAKNVSYNDSSWDAVSVPHDPPMNESGPDPLRPTWPDYSYEGVSWYRKHFTLDSAMDDKKIFIEFEAANTVTDVWVNGTHLTTHYGGYLPFTVDITDVANFGTENVIAVKVDNTDNTDVPIGNTGWFNWGGIYRDVWLTATNKLHITNAVYADVTAGGGIFVTYPSVSTSQARVQVKTHVQNETMAAKDCTVKTFIVDDDNMVVAEAAGTLTIATGSADTFTQTVDVMNPSLWHPHHPSLYTVYTKVYDADSLVDTCQTRIGIRSISFSRAEGFQINGETFRFRGTNRLQDYPYVGYAMGNSAQRRDAEKLKEAGFDYIRTSHYPQDPEFMDACDELGILVLDAIPGFQYVGGTTFKNNSYDNMRDMIRRDRNHPCVIAWELSLNETNFDSTYAQTAVSIGHAEYPGDQCYIAGWKLDSIYDIYIATPTAGARSYSGSKPLIISEYGHWEYNYNGYSDVYRGDVGSGGNYGELAMLNQILNHQDGLNQNLGMTYLCGDGLWVGIDYGPYPQGVLDSFRIPKFSYYFFQSQRDPGVSIDGIDSGPMVFIANYWTASSPTDITVFSNCEQIKLYINDVLQDTRTPDTGSGIENLLHPPFTFSGLSFQSGQLKAEGLIDGQVVATHIVNTPGSANALAVEFDVTDVEANGSDTIFVYASVCDSSSMVVPDASNNVTFNVSGEATLISPATVSAEAGIATALIRVSDQPGMITVMATATELGSDNASITSR